MTGTDQSVGRAVPEHILSLEQIIKVIGRTRMEIMLSLSTYLSHKEWKNIVTWLVVSRVVWIYFLFRAGGEANAAV